MGDVTRSERVFMNCLVSMSSIVELYEQRELATSVSSKTHRHLLSTDARAKQQQKSWLSCERAYFTVYKP